MPSQQAVETEEEAGVPDLSGRWLSMQIDAAKSHWMNPHFPLTTYRKSKWSHVCTLDSF